VIVWRVGHPELGEHATYVALNGSFGQDEFGDDTAIGQPLGNERQDLVLTLAQVGQWTELLWPVKQLIDDRRVDYTFAGGDALDGGTEGVQVGDGFLEEVAASRRP
jgi:hypothetical protein